MFHNMNLYLKITGQRYNIFAIYASLSLLFLDFFCNGNSGTGLHTCSTGGRSPIPARPCLTTQVQRTTRLYITDIRSPASKVTSKQTGKTTNHHLSLAARGVRLITYKKTTGRPLSRKINLSQKSPTNLTICHS